MANLGRLKASDYFIYKVKPGEQLSRILYDQFNFSPVYGPHGYINRVILVNTGKVLRKGDLVRAGDLIMIPKGPRAFDEREGSSTDASVSPAPSVRQLRPSAQVQLKTRSSAKRFPATEASDRPIEPADEQARDQTSDQAAEQAADEASAEAKIPTNKKASARARMPKVKKHKRKRPVVSADEFEGTSDFSANVGASYIGLFGTQKSNNTQGQFLSSLSPQIEVEWRQHWSPTFYTRFHGNSQFIDFLAPQRGTSLTNAHVVKTDFGFGVGSTHGTIHPSLDFKIVQASYYTALSSTIFRIDQIPVLQIQPQAAVRLLDVYPLSLDALIGVSYFSGASYDNYSLENGYGFNGALKVSHDFETTQFGCKLEFEERYQNSTYLNLNERQVGVLCGFAKPY